MVHNMSSRILTEVDIHNFILVKSVINKLFFFVISKYIEIT